MSFSIFIFYITYMQIQNLNVWNYHVLLDLFMKCSRLKKNLARNVTLEFEFEFDFICFHSAVISDIFLVRLCTYFQSKSSGENMQNLDFKNFNLFKFRLLSYVHRKAASCYHKQAVTYMLEICRFIVLQQLAF